MRISTIWDKSEWEWIEFLWALSVGGFLSRLKWLSVSFIYFPTGRKSEKLFLLYLMVPSNKAEPKHWKLFHSRNSLHFLYEERKVICRIKTQLIYSRIFLFEKYAESIFSVFLNPDNSAVLETIEVSFNITNGKCNKSSTSWQTVFALSLKRLQPQRSTYIFKIIILRLSKASISYYIFPSLFAHCYNIGTYLNLILVSFLKSNHIVLLLYSTRQPFPSSTHVAEALD